MPPDEAAPHGAAPALDDLPCGALSFGDDGTVVYANAHLARLLGHAPDAAPGAGAGLVGRRVETLLTIAGRIFFQTHLFPLLRLHGEAREIFVLLRHADGADVGVLVNAVRRERGGAAVSDCVLVEVRERRKFEDALLHARREAEAANARLEAQAAELALQHERLQDQAVELEAQGEELVAINEDLVDRGEQLERARAEAEEANRAKSQFLATMSHELRTPLNAIGGYVQLLELAIYGPVNDAQRDALARVERAQRYLLRLVNDVLNLARIEAGHVDYAMADVPVAEAVAAVLPMIEPQLAAAGLALDCALAAGVVARADRDKLQQVLLNLLTNAVKFTPPGGRIAVASEDADGRVLVQVRDTGIGIPPDKLAAVFEPFVQVEVERAQRREGTGLGLAISRDLARGMGGDLSADSVPGEGSTFTLALARA